MAAADARREADAAPAEANAVVAIVVVGKRKADAVGRAGTTPRSRVTAGGFDAPNVSTPFAVVVTVAFAISIAFVVVWVVVWVVVVVSVCSLTITAAWTRATKASSARMARASAGAHCTASNMLADDNEEADDDEADDEVEDEEENDEDEAEEVVAAAVAVAAADEPAAAGPAEPIEDASRVDGRRRAASAATNGRKS